jgi:rubrerythrin
MQETTAGRESEATHCLKKANQKPRLNSMLSQPYSPEKALSTTLKEMKRYIKQSKKSQPELEPAQVEHSQDDRQEQRFKRVEHAFQVKRRQTQSLLLK